MKKTINFISKYQIVIFYFIWWMLIFTFTFTPICRAASNGLLVKVKAPASGQKPSTPAVKYALSGMRVDFENIEQVIIQPNNAAQKNFHTDHDLSRLFKLTPKSTANLQNLIKQLQQADWVEYVEVNRCYEIAGQPNDPLFPEQWALHSTIDSEIEMIQHQYPALANSKVVVGMLDTGIDINHPDLQKNIWHNPGEIPDNGIDDDRNGFIDDYQGWDFSESDNQPLPEKMENENRDYGWHGTHCAGILGAVRDNGEGIAGVTEHGSIMAVKIFPRAYLDVIIRAIVYAVDNGAQILSNSWGGYFAALSLREALAYAVDRGVLCFFPAGNQNCDHSFYPAAFPEIIAVAATNRFKQKALFSNYGNWVDLAAPGQDILSTGPTNYGYYPAYFYQSGTSMAVPFAAGVAVALKARFPDWSAQQIRNHLSRTTNGIDAEYPLGAGQINYWMALNCPPESTLTIFSQTLPPAQKYLNYQTQLVAWAGVPPYIWSLKNMTGLPKGLHFHNKGEIFGTPREAGEYWLHFAVNDKNNSPAEITLRLTVKDHNFQTQTTERKNFTARSHAVLFQNSPNPFSLSARVNSNSTAISFYNPKAGRIKLEIFNLLGQKVNSLLTGRVYPGEYTLKWDGNDVTGQPVPAGVYFYKLSGADFRLCRKLLVVE